jgi:hypothetical protein
VAMDDLKQGKPVLVPEGLLDLLEK